VILDEVLVDQQCKISICIPSELIYFEGHFTNIPILPGIVQIHWAEAFGRRIFSIDIPFQGLEVIKFQKLIFPNNKLTVTLNYDNGKKRLSFMYESKKGVHSSGRISFA
jgi:3-hydroxymyristoyl/3-hydroxydecanoyl-(acyl carrier protein) dehydratase